MRTPNGYLEHGTWYTHGDRPIRQATRPELLYARLLAWKRRKAWRSLAHMIIAHKRAQQPS
jgi:hypothetical protein